MSVERPDPVKLRELALQVAREAAAVVRHRGGGAVHVADTKTSQTDVVTEIDRASETLVRTRLLAARPDDGLLGEEGSDITGTSGVRWIVDPIDGTVNFLYGLPDHAVSIAAELDGVIVAGVVINVGSRDEYAAARGLGATQNGQPLAVRAPTPLSHRLVITGFSYDPVYRVNRAEAITRLMPYIRDIRRLGSAALDICHVAAGRADAYVEEGVHIWDVAAAGLIAEEAGATVGNLVGEDGREVVVVAPSHGYDEFLEAVYQCGYLPRSGETTRS